MNTTKEELQERAQLVRIHEANCKIEFPSPEEANFRIAIIYAWKDGKFDGWRAKTENGRIKSTSTGSPESAAMNAALRFFWGGNTNHFAGPEERRATLISARGPTATFVAWLDQTYINSQPPTLIQP